MHTGIPVICLNDGQTQKAGGLANWPLWYKLHPPSIYLEHPRRSIYLDHSLCQYIPRTPQYLSIYLERRNISVYTSNAAIFQYIPQTAQHLSIYLKHCNISVYP